MTDQPETSKKKKKVYASPKLVRLGSVRELTAGGGGSITDGPFTTKSGGRG
jgi:hypothetical protein